MRSRTRKMLFLGLGAVVLSGCRRDMQDQPKYKPLAASRVFADGRAARPIPANTVARDEFDDTDVFHTGKTGGQWIETLPVPVTMALLERGQERFDIFCAPCHARIGDGNGMVQRRGFLRPADLHSDRVRQEPPGYIFDVITNGFGAMPDHRDQVPAADRWAIVAYIRALQLSRDSRLEDVPDEIRSQVASLRPGGSMLPPGKQFEPIPPPAEGQR